MDITAVVVCDDRPRTPGPLAPIDGQPMVVGAVRALLDGGLVDRVTVFVRAGRAGAIEQACRALPVSVRSGLATVAVRTDAGRPGVDDAPHPTGSGEIVLLHDAARPLAPPELAVAVIDAVRRGHPVAVPVLPLTDSVKQVDAAGVVIDSPDRAGLCVMQTPVAVRAELLAELPDGPPLRVIARLVEAGVWVHGVPGHPLGFAVRTAWDLELAELLARVGSNR